MIQGDNRGQTEKATHSLDGLGGRITEPQVIIIFLDLVLFLLQGVDLRYHMGLVQHQLFFHFFTLE